MNPRISNSLEASLQSLIVHNISRPKAPAPIITIFLGLFDDELSDFITINILFSG
jgi:hypothetical protein